MSHAIHRVTRFDIVGPYTIKVGFEDSTDQEINFRPVLHGPIFGPLQELSVFDAVVLDPEVGTLTWPNGADFDPATLHDWPAVCGELAARACKWAEFAMANQQRATETVEPTRR